MTDDEIKKIEQRAYSRGYIAGRKKQKVERNADRRHQEHLAFLDRAFLAALPACIRAQGWKRGDEPITSKEDRVRLAWSFAEAALKQRRR